MTVANGHTDSIDTGACLTQVPGEEWLFAGRASMHVKVRCAICGHESNQVVWSHWYVHVNRLPEVWICDDHQRDWL